ncbi:MAG: succinylglutamate desuccinylase/aspartoacylase family protein [Planctomycetaceae bacterium]
MVVLQQRKFVGSKPKPHVLITGGVHGDEFEPMEALRLLAGRLEEFSVTGTVTLVPVVNEAAFRRGARIAEDGLDLARTCPGRADGSITEQTARALSDLIQTADFYIDLHTGGTRLKAMPLSGYMLHTDPAVLDWQRKMARAMNLPVIWGTDYRLNGRSLSVARDANIPAIYTEYHGGGGCDEDGVDAYFNGCLNVLALFGMIQRPVFDPPTPPLVVEDDRPSSGHLQVNLPSPMEGFFSPLVELGERVEKDQIIGSVSNVLGDDQRPVRAPHAGIVLLLHTFSRVDQGECLGAILETANSLPLE